MQIEEQPVSPWMKPVLRAAGIYNLCWGTWVILFPLASMKVCGYPNPPTYPEFWQCIGMIVGVYGIGYWIAASDPYRHWPIVLVGFLGKVLGPIGFLYGWTIGRLPLTAGIVNITNDLIWWGPFAVILWRALRFEQIRRTTGESPVDFDQAIREFHDQSGQSLFERSQRQDVLVVFLRHSGCTFCRETLAQIQQQRQQIEAAGTQIAFVHMEPDEELARNLFAKYGVEDLPRICDSEQVLYRAFEVGVGRFRQLMSWRIIWRGFRAAILNRHGFSRVRGNAFRLPGAFVLRDGEVIHRYHPRDAADHPDYSEFVCEVPHEII